MTRMIIADVQDVCVCVRAIFQLSSGSKDAVAPLLTLYGIFRGTFASLMNQFGLQTSIQ